MQNNNVLEMLCVRFALRIIRLYDYLKKEKGEYVMSKQVYRSGTSIGANVAESKAAQSDADFISKLSIALKEANETKYLLLLLHESCILDDDRAYDSIVNDLNTIIGTLVIILKKVKGVQNSPPSGTIPPPSGTIPPPTGTIH